MRENPSKLFIVKPSMGAFGAGIYLIKNFSELQAHGHDGAVVQEYQEKPYLLGGKKWDMRVLVLIVGLSPMKVYITR
jgi:glutathione synthase/RimK-type ligase-like ATP-grasp enzyme